MVGGTVGIQVIASVLTFGAGIITARGLGPQGRASLAVMIAVPALFRVVGVLGLDSANARFAGLSHSAFRQLVRRAVVFSAVAGTALAAAWWFAGSRWPVLLLGLSPRLALTSAALCPVSLLVTLLGGAEIGRGRVSVYNLATAATGVAYLVGVLLLLVVGHVTVAGCFAACAASQVLGVILLLALAAVRVHPDGERVRLRRYMGYALRAYPPNLGYYAMLRMDVPVIQVMAGTAAVALYAVALPLAECLLLIPAAVAVVIIPRVTSGAVDQQAANRIGRTVVAATAVLAAAVGLASPVFIPVVYGTPYRGSVAVVWCMLPGMVFFSIGRTKQAYFAATDRLRPGIVATLAGAAVGLACLTALTVRLGAIGAGVADSAGYLAFTVVLVGGMPRSGPLRRQITTWLWRCWRQALRVPAAMAARGTWQAAAGCGAVAAGLAAGVLADRSTVSLITIAGVMVLLITVAMPDCGLYLLAVAAPVSQTSLGTSLITDKDLVILIGGCLAGRLATGRLVHRKYGQVVLAVSLVSYFALSATLPGGSGGNWRYVLILGMPLLCLPLIADADETTRRAVMLLGFSAACLAVPEILQAHASLAALGNISAAQSAVVAANQTGAVNHNSEGALFVLALAVLLARLGRTRGGARIAVVAAIVLVVAGVAYSFSRASYLGALAVIAVYAARRSVRGVAGAAIGLGGLLPLLPAAVTARLGTVWSPNGMDPDSAVRLDLWSSAIRMFDAHPVFGVGDLHFAAQLPAYFSSSGNYDSFLIQFSLLDHAHNTFLTVLAETGIVGGLLVLALGVSGWHKGWRAMRAADWAGEGAVLAFIGVGVCSAFGEVLLVPAILAMFLLVVLAAGGDPAGGR
jgi:O-antigen/teichoic acid export membrane protein/O-antigen ligase